MLLFGSLDSAIMSDNKREVRRRRSFARTGLRRPTWTTVRPSNGPSFGPCIEGQLGAIAAATPVIDFAVALVPAAIPLDSPRATVNS